MYRALSARSWVLLIWTILISVSLYVRPLFPVDETRYAAVAWEMWSRNDFLVPHLNGETYSHKPPLLFWLMILSWKLFGVNDWSIRIISPLFSLAILYLSGKVALLIWPNHRKLDDVTPLILLGSLIWQVFSTLTMFDMMLAFFVIFGIYSLLKLTDSGLSLMRWAALSLAVGGGALTKGPVILLHLLPVALLAPWWLGEKIVKFRWTHWYAGLFLSVLFGALIALSWAIPAGIAGGEAYRNAIFLGQTSGRLVKSFAHESPWWWYFQVLPLLLLPWLLCKPMWSGLKKLTFKEFGMRFCLAWIIPVFIAFSLVSGKRLHYLLPLIPGLALILARTADEITDRNRWERAHLVIAAVYGLLGAILLFLLWLNNLYHWRTELSSISPAWGALLCAGSILLGLQKAANVQESVFYVCVASVMASLIISSGFFSTQARFYDTRETALQISSLMSENRDIAYYTGKYHGQYHFTGRLKQPISVLPNSDFLYAWAKNHPSGYIIVEYREHDALPASVLSHHYPLKSHFVGLLSSKVLFENPSLRAVLKPSG